MREEQVAGKRCPKEKSPRSLPLPQALHWIWEGPHAGGVTPSKSSDFSEPQFSHL